MNQPMLKDQLCFKLYALSRKVTAVYRPVLDELDITYPQYLVLMVLWEAETITVKDLGNRLYLDSGTLTPLLKRMEDKNLLGRKRDETDERSVIIALRSTGRALLQKAADIPKALSSCLSISQDKYQQLKEQLDNLLMQLAD